MASFDERERDFEARFKHDQELAFKVKARRAKLLGLWAARHMGLDDKAAETYAKEVAVAQFAGRGDVIAKIAADFAARQVKIDAVRIADELQRLGEEARRQIQSA
ncbi:MAG: DUF1476 domain-containing protein [Alphaproteobacteria bacterium]|nr:DUF1476 domain-containing protein [Alphaproteobacteria bacterium]